LSPRATRLSAPPSSFFRPPTVVSLGRLSAPPSSFFRPPNSGGRRAGTRRSHISQGGASSSPSPCEGTVKPARTLADFTVHRLFIFRDASTIMHGACPIGNATIGPRSRRAAFKSVLVRVKLMYDFSACWRKLLARVDPTENTRRAQSIISYSPLPRSSTLPMHG
jgi:hypothetical protein